MYCADIWTLPVVFGMLVFGPLTGQTTPTEKDLITQNHKYGSSYRSPTYSTVGCFGPSCCYTFVVYMFSLVYVYSIVLIRLGKLIAGTEAGAAGEPPEVAVEAAVRRLWPSARPTGKTGSGAWSP